MDQTRFLALEARVAQLESTVDQSHQQYTVEFVALRDEIRGVEQRLDRKINLVEDRLVLIIQKVQTDLQKDFGRLEQKFAQLEQRFVELAGLVEQRFSSIIGILEHSTHSKTRARPKSKKQ